jgi:plastocyanin
MGASHQLLGCVSPRERPVLRTELANATLRSAPVRTNVKEAGNVRARWITAGAAVAAVATGGALAAQAASGAPERPAAATVHLSASRTKLAFNVKSLSARHGKVTLVMANPSSSQHAIAIEGHGVDKDGKIVGKGRTSTVTVTVKKGRYTFYCPVLGYCVVGMKGMITVI